MAYLILYIETIPRLPIDEVVEETVAKKVQAYIDRAGDNPENANSLIRSTAPFFVSCFVLECAGFKVQGDGSSRDKVVCEDNEENTLHSFIKIINHSNTKGVRFVHYNGLGFDIAFLIIRATHYGIEINNWNFTNLRRFSYKSHIDLMMYLCNWNNYNAISMDVACRAHLEFPLLRKGK